jgi:porin
MSQAKALAALGVSATPRRPVPSLQAIAAALASAILAAAAPALAEPVDPKDAPIQTVKDAPVSPTAEPQQPDLAAGHLFGDWGGLRTTLAERGVDLEADYTTETAWNVSGGRKQGADYAHQVGLAINVDWQKLAGIPGFSTHAVFVNRAGRNTSADYIGDPVIQAQEIYGAGFNMGAKLVLLSVEEQLWNGRVDVEAGRLSVGADFAASPLYCNFMTLTICGHPRALTSNQGFTDWPTASWGGRIRVRPTPDTYIMAGVYESKPFPPGGRTGFDWSTHGQTGQTYPVEAAWEPVFGSAALTGHYKVGMAYDNSEFPDYYYDASGQPLVVSGATPRSHNGRTSVWFTADQMVKRNGPGQNDGLILMAAYAHNSPDTSLFEHFAWVGLLDRGFWRSRPNDQIGFAVTYYKVSPSLTARERLQQDLNQPFSDGVYGVQSDAVVIEANYSIPVYRGIDIQPEVEYFVRPGGQRAVSNSLVFGLKTHVQF